MRCMGISAWICADWAPPSALATCWMAVSITPGCTVLTRMPSAAVSSASTLLIMRTPPLLAA